MIDVIHVSIARHINTIAAHLETAAPGDRDKNKASSIPINILVATIIKSLASCFDNFRTSRIFILALKLLGQSFESLYQLLREILVIFAVVTRNFALWLGLRFSCDCWSQGVLRGFLLRCRLKTEESSTEHFRLAKFQDALGKEYAVPPRWPQFFP